MPGTFGARIGVLRRQVPHQVSATIGVDQVYAKYQLLRDDLRHPRGGIAHYLDTALRGTSREPYSRAAPLLLAGGAVGGFTQGSIAIAQSSERLTPIDTYLLRGSTSVTVTSDGRVVGYRPPTYPRLSREALKAWRKVHAQPAQRHTLEQGRRSARGRVPR